MDFSITATLNGTAIKLGREEGRGEGRGRGKKETERELDFSTTDKLNKPFLNSP